MNRYCRPAFLLFFLALCLTTSRAQQFQQPTPEELSMTTDAKAPGADAVYLYNEEIVDNESSFHSYYVRIKVLTEKGKELATVKIPYLPGEFKVQDIKGRTIHADGAIVALDTKPTDLMAFKSGKAQVNEMVFTLPAVEVGSILEYKLTVRYQDSLVIEPRWEVQKRYFVHKAHYSFKPSEGFIRNYRGERLTQLLYSITPGVGLDLKRTMNSNFTLDVVDVPAIVDEDWAPPMENITWHVYFYYTYASTGQGFWHNEGYHWQYWLVDFAKESGSIRAAVKEIVAPTDTDEQKARKLYDAMMKLENTDFARHRTEAERKAAKEKQINSVDEIWKQQRGNSNEIAVLYYTLLNAAGVKAWPMRVVDRSETIFDPSYLSMSQLEDYIVIANINGKEVYLDPGSRYCSFGLLNWRHYASGGMRINADGKETSITGTPGNVYTSATEQRVADITLNEDGTIKGSAHYVLEGPQALHWRQLTLTNDTDEVKTKFNEELQSILPDGVHAEFDHFLGLEDYNSKLIAIINLSGTLATATSKRYFLPGQFFESHAKHPFVSQEKRVAPIDYHYARMIQDEVTYNLPKGYSVESAPQSGDINWPQHAILRIKSVVEGSDITIKRTFLNNYIYLANKDYTDLHDYYLKVAASDQQQLVLTTAPPPGK
jgi:hypothetical protein